jgi:hypothetical protein
LILGVLSPACSSSKPASTAPPASASPPAIDPLADNIFDAVSTQITRKGVVNVEPKTDADWEKIRIGAVTMAEGAYLLKVPRPFAPPGDENDSAGPNPVELSPAQITAKVERDPVEWNARIEALRNVGLQVSSTS